MILDASALVAIALDEPARAMLVAKINAAETVAVAAPTLVEAGIVLSARSGQEASELLSELVVAADMVVIEFGPRHWQEAISAWWRFGNVVVIKHWSKRRHRSPLRRVREVLTPIGMGARNRNKERTGSDLP